MILIPQTVIRDCLAVFRRALPKPFLARAATTVQLIGGPDGVHLRLLQPDIAVEYHHPSPSKRCAFALPISALVDCEGRGNDTVQFQVNRNGKVDARWEQSGTPHHREFPAHESPATTFPEWPSRDTANEPSLLEVLAEAMQIPIGGTGRLALNCIQLRGQQGDLVATDGRQLLIQGGFRFPWQEAVLVTRTALFAAKELPKGEVVRVGLTKTHVHVRIGAWTIALRRDTSTRFPNVEAVIPKTALPMARCHFSDDEAPALAAMLDLLPAAKEEFAPLTLDLARTVVVRARAEGEQRCTEVALPHSRLEGKPVRLAMNRRFLQCALNMGFRSILVTGPDKPLLCQDGKRLYVWVGLDPNGALPPQANATRLKLSSLPEKNRTTVVTPTKERLATPPAAKPPARVFGKLATYARGLWDLVRRHHRQQPMK